MRTRTARKSSGWAGIMSDYDDDPYDDYGHGTHVMGIAAARTNNGVGIAGLCPGCSALAIKVLGSSGSGSWSGVADGIVLAADATTALGKRVIINLSLGGDSIPSIVADAVTYARSQGCVVVAAAGNYGPGPTMFPASLPGVIAVSATDDYRSSRSAAVRDVLQPVWGPWGAGRIHLRLAPSVRPAMAI